ncbi:MAG: PilZ domain-containing protein [Planctomycetia bacterium]|nr:PilZ domain-containing protein [Planctomycetia bacterium]
MFSERRRNFRSPVAGTREGTLIVAGVELRVRLIDESAGGMNVASESMPQFGEGTVAEFETDDGDTYRVQVMHIVQRGLCARMGLKRLETLTHAGKSIAPKVERPSQKMLRVAIIAGIGLTIGFVAQAEPIRKQLSKVPVLGKLFPAVEEKSSGAVVTKVSASIRQRLRESFDIDLFDEPEVIGLLHLRPEQQTKIRSVIAAKNSVLRANVPKSQQAAILYITQMAMLGVLDTEQVYRLESLVEHTIGATDLLQKLVMQYWPTADAEELYRRLGAPALALPQMAEHLRLNEQQLRAIRQIIDEALDKSESLYRQSKGGPKEDELLTSAFGYLDHARAKCMAVLTPEQQQIVNGFADK